MNILQRALVYLRVSTDAQASKGISIPTQKEQCLNFAVRSGYAVSEGDVFADEGESARTSDRPEFQRLLERCRQERGIKAVIVFDISRFSRNGVEYYIAKRQLKKLGISILSVSEPIGAIDKIESPSSWFLEWMLAGSAELRSRQDAEKIAAGLRRKAMGGMHPGLAPFGYKNRRETISGDKHKSWIEIDESEAVWVKRTFELYASGQYAFNDLAVKLEREGFPMRNGKRIHASFIERIIKDEYYIRILKWRDIVVEGTQEQIVDKSVFYRAQAVREAHNAGANRKRKHSFALRGVAVCGGCGCRWTAGFHRGKSGKQYGFYRCQKSQRGIEVLCNQPYVSIADLEKQFAGLFQYVHLTKHAVERIREKVQVIFAREQEIYERMRDNYLSEIKRVGEHKNRLLRLYMSGGVADEQYDIEKKRLEAEEIKAKDNFGEVESELRRVIRVIEIAVGLANNISRVYQKSPYELKIILAHAFFEKIVIRDTKIAQATLNAPLDYFCAKRLQGNPVFQLEGIGGDEGN